MTPATQGLEAFFDCEALLCQLVDAGQEGLAQSWAAVLGPELKVCVFVCMCMHMCTRIQWLGYFYYLLCACVSVQVHVHVY